jgi:hypothetical protein
MFSRFKKRVVFVPSWTVLTEHAGSDLKNQIKEKGNADPDEYEKLRSTVLTKAHIPTWKEFFDHAIPGCEARIYSAKERSANQTVAYLKERMDLIMSVREKNHISPEDYHDIRPFVEEGYLVSGYNVHPKKTHHLKKR